MKFVRIRLDTNSMLWDVEMRPYFNPPENSMIDSAHCFLSSGGVAQYQCNEYVRVLQCHDFSLEQIDEFSDSCRWATKRLQNGFFSCRWGKKKGSHIRAFASEVRDCVIVLVCLTRMLVCHSDVPQAHQDCMLLLGHILDIYTLQDQALQFLDDLDTLTVTYFQMVEFLYECCVIPKLHMQLHIPRIMRKLQWYMDTLAWERKHKEVKGFLDQAKGKALESVHEHVNRRMLIHFFDALSDPRFFSCVQLLHPIAFTAKKKWFCEAAFGIVLQGECFWSSSCHCARGVIKQNCFVLVMAPSMVVAKVLLIVEDKAGVVLVLDLYRHVDGYVWTSKTEVRLCSALRVCCIPPTREVPAGVWVMLPEVMVIPNYEERA